MPTSPPSSPAGRCSARPTSISSRSTPSTTSCCPYDLILTIAGATGDVDYYGNSSEVPLFDRFFIGGSRSVRGFSNRDIGPVDFNNIPLGGDTMAYGNLELTFPIMERVRGAVFTDAGFLDASAFHYEDAYNELNAAAGVGLRLNLPIGPLRLDYGYSLQRPRLQPQYAASLALTWATNFESLRRLMNKLLLLCYSFLAPDFARLGRPEDRRGRS